MTRSIEGTRPRPGSWTRSRLRRTLRPTKAPWLACAVTVAALGFAWTTAAHGGAGPSHGPSPDPTSPGDGGEHAEAEEARAPSMQPAAPRGETARRDLRSTVILRYECASDIGRREVTLFANGTVRLREGPPGEETMQLGELDPVALDGFRVRLEEEDLEGLRGDYRNVEGDWIERCVLELPERRAAASTPGGAPWRFRFSRYGTLPLALSRVVRIAEEVGAVAEGERGPGLPEGYEPVRGDVLERADGSRFQVVNLTGEGKGVELRGVDSPLTIYVPLEELSGEFSDLVSRKEDR